MRKKRSTFRRRNGRFGHSTNTAAVSKRDIHREFASDKGWLVRRAAALLGRPVPRAYRAG